MNAPAAAPAAAPARVTRIARRRARPGHEAEYEVDVARDARQDARASRVFWGDLIPPEAPGEEYQLVVRFASEAELQAWDMSDARGALLERMKAVAEGEPEFRKLSGLEAWFEPAVVPADDAPAARAHGAGDLDGHLPDGVPLPVVSLLPWIQAAAFPAAHRGAHRADRGDDDLGGDAEAHPRAARLPESAAQGLSGRSPLRPAIRAVAVPRPGGETLRPAQLRRRAADRCVTAPR